MTRSNGCLDMSFPLRYFYFKRTRFPYSARHQKAWRFLLTILARLTRLYPAKILSQIEDDTGVVPIEILAQAKGKEAPNDALPTFLQLYTSSKRVGTLLKEPHTGKLVNEWEKLVADSDNKPDLVDMSPAVSAFMAVKDEEELVCSY